MNIGIIGLGLIGQQRARAVAALPPHRVVAVFDPEVSRAGKLASELKYDVEPTSNALLTRTDVDVVVVAVPHVYTRDLVIASFRAGKHVFCEKPLGRTAPECEAILAAAAKAGRRLGAGFNYRYYPGVREAYRRIRQGDLGKLTHMRCVMGHGGRPGMEKEWKTSKQMCGGGALLDPGIHIVDLVQHFAGPIVASQAHLSRSFWDIDVCDNAFVTFDTEQSCIAQCHLSITEWKSTFSIDVFGTDGSVHIRGRGGFYGAQRSKFNRRWEWMHPDRPTEAEIQYGSEDVSFRDELGAFLKSIESGSLPSELGTGEDGLSAIRVIDTVYATTPVMGLPQRAHAVR